jgi:hypothetical protein
MIERLDALELPWRGYWRGDAIARMDGGVAVARTKDQVKEKFF